MEMRPPNLKFKVLRNFDPFIHPELRQKIDQNVIAFEGAGLTSDTRLRVLTQWRDFDDKLLPESLLGFTGRITKVSEPNVLQTETQDVVAPS